MKIKKRKRREKIHKIGHSNKFGIFISSVCRSSIQFERGVKGENCLNFFAYSNIIFKKIHKKSKVHSKLLRIYKYIKLLIRII